MSEEVKKRAPELTVEDFEHYPIWKYTNADEVKLDETVVSPVPKLPVDDLTSCLIGTKVLLNNGTTVSAVLSNIALDNALQTKHFLMIAVAWKRVWFYLADYSEVDYERRSPQKLAEIMGLRLDEVFPIRYDISALAVGPAGIVQGMIPAEPEVRLTLEERIRLAITGRL